MAVLYANVSPLHKPHCTTDRDDDREGKRERGWFAVQWASGKKEGGREEEGRRPFKDPHYLNVAKTLLYPTWMSEGRGALFAYSRARRPLMSDRASGRGAWNE